MKTKSKREKMSKMSSRRRSLELRSFLFDLGGGRYFCEYSRDYRGGGGGGGGRKHKSVIDLHHFSHNNK